MDIIILDLFFFNLYLKDVLTHCICICICICILLWSSNELRKCGLGHPLARGSHRAAPTIFIYFFFIVRFHYTGISPCSFHEKCSGFFNVHRVWLSYTRDRRLKVSSERLGNEDKAPCLRAQLPWLGFEPGTSALSVRGLNHSATAAPLYYRHIRCNQSPVNVFQWNISN